MVACEEDWFEVVKELLQHPSIDYNAKDKLGKTAFLKACAKGHYKIVSLLFNNKGEKIDVSATDDDGINALQVAYEEGHSNVVSFLHINVFQGYKNSFLFYE